MFKKLHDSHPRVRWRTSLSISVRQNTASNSRQRSPLPTVDKPSTSHRPMRHPLLVSRSKRPPQLESFELSYDENTMSKSIEPVDTFNPVLPCLITKDLKYSSSPRLPSIARKTLKTCGKKPFGRQNSFKLSGWEPYNDDLMLEDLIDGSICL